MTDAGWCGQLDGLTAALSRLDTTADAGVQLHEILRHGFGVLPLPGSGATLKRWQALASVAQHNLSLAKLYEGHTDALAIMSELAADDAQVENFAANVWGVWAAENAQSRVTITPLSGKPVRLDGTKSWCSGARTVTHALLTAWHPDGRGPHLVRVAMRQAGVSVSSAAWAAVGMADSTSVDVTFSGADAHLVGDTGDYLSRPGFWQGGAGIAACWYGGAIGLGTALQQVLAESPAAARGAFRLAALGKVDLALHSTAALLRAAALWIDANPLGDASTVALRSRLAAENCAKIVLDESGRALGASAFCRNAHFARAAADLPVFVRQSHAERDFVALAERLVPGGITPWKL